MIDLDYPTAWAIQNEGKLEHTNPKCSAVQTGGAILCDCGAVVAEWRRRQADGPEDEPMLVLLARDHPQGEIHLVERATGVEGETTYTAKDVVDAYRAGRDDARTKAEGEKAEAHSLRTCTGCAWCCQSTPAEKRGQGHKGCAS